MSRWSNWSRGEQEKPRFLGNFVKERLAALYDGLWDTEYPEDAAREEPKPDGLMGNRSRVDSLINRMRGKGQIGTGQSGLIRKAMNIDSEDSMRGNAPRNLGDSGISKIAKILFDNDD